MNDLTTEIKKLEIKTLDNLKLSKAKNTIRAYKSDFNDFALFCSKHGMKSMPTDPKIVSLYLTHLSKQSKYSTLKRRLASIKVMHTERQTFIGLPDYDIGLFFRSVGSPNWEKFESIPKIVAVTGSNGKSTTSAWIHNILQCENRPSQLAGNIGKGVFDLEPLVDGETIILELSSYQTEVANSLTPDVAVFINFTPDHLERHGGIGGYYAEKKRLFISGCPDRSVIGVDEFAGQLLAQEIADHSHDDRVIRVSSSKKITNIGWSVFANKGFLSEYRRGKQVASLDLRHFTVLQ